MLSIFSVALSDVRFSRVTASSITSILALLIARQSKLFQTLKHLLYQVVPFGISTGIMSTIIVPFLSKEMVETRLNFAELPSSTTFNFIYVLINVPFDNANLSY